MKKHNNVDSQKSKSTKRQWIDYADLEEQQNGKKEVQLSPYDQLEGDPELEMSGVSRRTFLGVMGSSAAFAGVGLSGCIRKPVTKIVPYAKRPEDIVEGKPLYFATAYQEGANVLGLTIESHEGRPTKVEGNKLHPESLGATDVTAQASVLGLYDLDRSFVPTQKDGTELTWDEAYKQLDNLVSDAKKERGVAFVLPAILSPTYKRLLKEAKNKWRNLKLYRADALWPEAAMEASALVAGQGAYPVTKLDKANVIVAFDSDFMGVEHDHVRHTKAFSKRRRVKNPNETMNRLYAVEPIFSLTGSMADHRLRAKAGDVGKILMSLANQLMNRGVTLPNINDAWVYTEIGEKASKFVKALAEDLLANRGKSVLLAGYRQPAWVHALTYAINDALGAANGGLQTWHVDEDLPEMEGLDALAKALEAGEISSVFAIDTNPAFLSPGELKLNELLAKAKLVHAGMHRDETGSMADLHIPISHYLEAWGDLSSLAGATAIQQPLIAPLQHTPSALEVFNRVATGEAENGYALVRDTWEGQAGFSEDTWTKWLHDGLVSNEAKASASPDFTKASDIIAAGSGFPTAGTEIIFAIDPSILDGRHANNAWLRELPDPMTKVSWDNPVLINKRTAGGLKIGELVNVKTKLESKLPVHLMPGLADGVAVVYVGLGREASGAGRVANQNGWNGWRIAPSQGWFTKGSFAAAGGKVKIANTQALGNSLTPSPKEGFGPSANPSNYKAGAHNESFGPRMLALEATVDEWKNDPTFPEKLNDRVLPKHHLKDWMYEERPGQKALVGNATIDDVYLNGVHQWGMAVDLSACTGCNACIIACQSENNIPVVGQEQMAKGREMYWIRLDRYFSGDEDDPQAIIQPLACVQCENAPCEAVCPVKATAHSNEGLNDMAYNRCIGTRYCSNNCPLKVRRFNYFNFNLDIHPLEQMQKNPDVTIRFRGVMEKCTYCVQRINRAKIDAKIHGNGRVQDGDIEVACQQACPADAISFGDLKDENSKVVQAKRLDRDYELLQHLNLRARTTYLAKVRNPNPDLV